MRFSSSAPAKPGVERVAGDRPERLQYRRPHAARGEKRVEMAEMLLLLRRHAGDQRGRLVAIPEHGELARVNTRRAIFAGLVDADHRVARRAAVAGTPVAHAARSLLARK